MIHDSYGHDYDSWGRVTFESGNHNLHPFGYAGGLYDADTGLVRFGVRDYDADTGRWTAPEPLGFAAETNWYRYANGDPVNYFDPTGRIAPLVVFGIAAILGSFGAGYWSGYDYQTNRPSREEHAQRNRRNSCPSTARCDMSDPRSAEWDVAWRKWRFEDGSECDYDDQGNFQPLDGNGEGGTFNFAPDPLTWPHVRDDFLPHFDDGGHGAYVQPDPTRVF